MNSTANGSPNQAASEKETTIKMEDKPVSEEPKELPKELPKEAEKTKDEKPEEDKPVKPSEKEEEKQATENAAAALTSLHESSKPSKEEKGSDNEDEEEEDDEPRDDSDFVIPLKLTKSGRKRATPFPLKLMKTLANPEFKEIIAWTESGKAFNILQPKLFTAQVLPEYFKTAKYSSFTRKLHRWGFMRHYRGPEAGAFFHKHFRRGRMDLVEKMTCSKPSGTPSTSNKTGKANRDNTPAMPMVMDTSASSRDSAGFRSHPNNMMGGAIGLPQLQTGPGSFSVLMQPQQMGGMGGIPQQFFMQGFGGMPQQQMLLQQQQMAAQQQGGNSGDSGLDAAIEMEVTRRLKERINAAAFSRQALSMMPQQGGGSAPNQMQQAQGHMQHPNMMQQSMMGGGGRPMFASGGGMGSPSLQGFPQGFKGFDHNQGSFMNVQDPYGMPSNIQGAKTA